MNNKTRRLAAMGILCALAYTAAAAGRVPLVLFLKYDPKDVVIALGGFIFGPLPALFIAGTVSLAEMLTVSETGVLGFVMNVISSCSFACTAALIHRRKRGIVGAAVGLFCGWLCMVSAMMLWNYLIAPFYMGYPREAVAEMLLPVFLPFNLLKGGLNAGISLLVYKAVLFSPQFRDMLRRK
ncbi:MAG: ECF transporter S component [Oscillospiraceae bacterium]|nr:ECF transporter S component [Oscillospiraceae bacterium]